MLAYDTVQPLGREDETSQGDREQQVQRELYQIAHAVIPQEYRDNPGDDFPPEIVMLLTRATIARAAQIMGMTDPADDVDADESREA